MEAVLLLIKLYNTFTDLLISHRKIQWSSWTFFYDYLNINQIQNFINSLIIISTLFSGFLPLLFQKIKLKLVKDITWNYFRL